MEKETLKKFIIENLFDKNNKFNNRITHYSWWVNRNYVQQYNAIIQYTDHLIDATLTQRVYDIMNDIEKPILCQNKNIKLIQFWDIEWIHKKEICKSIIKTNLGVNDVVYARKCVVNDVDNLSYKNFLETNHIQGYVPAKIVKGLYYNDELVALISFGKPRFNKNYEWELLRYCNKLGTNVVGGFSKLFKQCDLNNIISYSDKRLFTGDIYFLYLNDSPPNFFFYKGGATLSRMNCRRYNINKILKEYDETKSVHANMNREGWLKVYDCGNSVWVYNKRGS